MFFDKFIWRHIYDSSMVLMIFSGVNRFPFIQLSSLCAFSFIRKDSIRKWISLWGEGRLLTLHPSKAMPYQISPVDPEFESTFQETFQASHDPFSCLAALHQNDESSSAGESHPHALTEPDVNLSAHPAPIVQPLTEETANGQTTLAVSALCALSNAAPSAYGLPVSCISSLPTSPIFYQSVGRSDTLLICSSP